MSKVLKMKDLSERAGARALVALALSTSLAVFGCSTNRSPGNGNPVTTPGLRTSPTAGTTSGSETAPIPPPMFSSYSGIETGTVTPRTIRLSADAAAAVMAQHQPQPSVRVLGPVDPGPAGRPYATDLRATGTFVNPALVVNPQLTVNSSISSQPVAAVASGAGEAVSGTAVVGTLTDGFVDNVVVAAPAAAQGLTVGGNAGAAPVIGPSTATVTPTNAAIGVPAGTFATGTLSPTGSSVVNPPASISSLPRIAALSSTRAATTVTSNRTTTGVVARQLTTTSGRTATGTVSSPVRIVTGTNGRVTVTNVGSN